MIHKDNKKVLIGLSGGVDSAVSAWLLMQQGYQVEALFMKNWEEDDTSEYCNAAVDLADAEKICDKLQIKLHKVNFAAEYWDNVFVNFLDEYAANRTPNPDILCNREIKFKSFLYYAHKLGAKIATGHYAGIHQDDVGRYYLCKALDQSKDQSYFLYALNQYQLSQAIFPLHNITKDETRKIAQDLNLPVAQKKDSTGICFIGERKFRSFLEKFIPNQPGNIIDEHGKVLGQHLGTMYYTIGQRQGLGIGGDQQNAQPWYVIAKDVEANNLVVAKGNNHPKLFSRQLVATDLNWINPVEQSKFTCYAKVRYRQVEQEATVTCLEDGNKVQVDFLKPQRAVTPGQSIVFYQQDKCLGGGVIDIV